MSRVFDQLRLSPCPNHVPSHRELAPKFALCYRSIAFLAHLTTFQLAIRRTRYVQGLIAFSAASLGFTRTSFASLAD